MSTLAQGLSDEWQATQDWVTPTGDVNIDFLAAHFGQAQVWVSDTTRYYIPVHYTCHACARDSVLFS